MITIGLDLGGTNVTAIAHDGDEVLAATKHRTPTSGGRSDVLDLLSHAVDATMAAAGLKRKHIAAVGVGSPGIVTGGTVGNASNVPGFQLRFALDEEVAARTRLPVRVTNDVTAAAVGEHRLGSGRGEDDLLAVFVGTGVGGGLILGGRPFEGGTGGAGEFGHLVVRQGGAVCPCGRRGCVEAYAGRRAMVLAAEQAVAAGRSSILFEVMREKGKPRPTSGVFHDTLQRGDALLDELLEDAVATLAAGIATAVNLLDLGRVVVGGGLADKLGAPFVTRIEAAAQRSLFLQPPRARIVPAALGDHGGAIGAALVARDG